MEEERKPSLKTTKPPLHHPSLLDRVIDLDTKCSLHIHTICQPFPRFILKTLELAGDGRFWFPVPIALFFSPLPSKSDHLRSILIGLLIGSLLDLIFVGLIKFVIKRPRPVYNKGMHLTVAVDHWSFPSGHSSRVCFIAAFLYLSSALIVEALVQLGYSSGSDGKIVQMFISVVCFWSAGTSISRVLLGRHFVFDVIAALRIFHYYDGKDASSCERKPPGAVISRYLLCFSESELSSPDEHNGGGVKLMQVLFADNDVGRFSESLVVAQQDVYSMGVQS